MSLKFSVLFPHLTLLPFHTDPTSQEHLFLDLANKAGIWDAVGTNRKAEDKAITSFLPCGKQKISKWMGFSCHHCL